MVSTEIAGLLAEILEADPEDITPATELTLENGVEPIHIAKWVIRCEKKYKLTIHDEDVHTFKNVNDLAEAIEKILDEGAAPVSTDDEKDRTAWYYQ